MADGGTPEGGTPRGGTAGGRARPVRGLRTVFTTPFTRRAWAEAAYCLAAFPLAVTGFLLLVVLLCVGCALVVSLVGAVLGALLLTGALALARLQGGAHRGLARLLGERVPAPAAPAPGVGVLGRFDARLRDGAGWRCVAYALVKLPVSAFGMYGVLWWVIGVVDLSTPLRWALLGQYPDHGGPHGAPTLTPLPFGGSPRFHTLTGTLAAAAVGAVLLLAAPWLTRAVVRVDRRLLRELLGPGALAERVRDLEETRALAVDDTAALLRRVERDLHDGAQVRLVALAMSLDMIREGLDGGRGGSAVDAGSTASGSTEGTGGAGGDGSRESQDGREGREHGRSRQSPGGTGSAPASGGPDGAGRDRLRRLVETAHRSATEAIGELRDLARGIHPPVLDDGLPDALATLAARSTVPVDLSVDLPVRPTAAIETMAYFCAAELLTNVIKHSGARRASLTAVQQEGLLRLCVRDDGRGGAAPGAGSGLAGLRQRVRPVDGRLLVDSPPGGPTAVTVELPLRA